MSRDNVEVVRSGYERFNGGERVPPADLWHVGCEYIPDRQDPDPGTHRGLAAIAKVYRDRRWGESQAARRADRDRHRPSGEINIAYQVLGDGPLDLPACARHLRAPRLL